MANVYFSVTQIPRKMLLLVLGSGSGKHEDHDMIQDLRFFVFVRNNPQALQKTAEV